MITSEFVFAGNSKFTVSNNKGEHFTFRVKKHRHRDVYYARVLAGPEVYNYMGILTKDTHIVVRGHKGMSPNAKSVKVLNWAMKVIDGKKELPDGYNIQHEGTCGACNRPLTDPESIRTGMGPVCSGRAKVLANNLRREHGEQTTLEL